MRNGRFGRGEALKTWLLLPALGLSLWAQERPLPQVAREKPGKTASRVFTNEDLESGKARTESPPSGAAKGANAEAGAKEKTTARVTVPGLLQEATPGEARAVLKSLQHDEEVLLRRYAQIEEKLTRESDEHLRQLYSDSLARREETLARKRGQILQMQKAIAAAESSHAASPGSQHERKGDVQK